MKIFVNLCIIIIILASCEVKKEGNSNQDTLATEQIATTDKIRLLIDTDANNELDDQHALAYALFSGDVFDVVGITVNDTYNGNGIEKQYAEALRVAKLCDAFPEVPVIAGAEGSYREIISFIDQEEYDGRAAVNFIIAQAQESTPEDPLILLPIGKLTNVALALAKAPEIKDRIKVVWLGSNYPKPGEYNLDNDTTSFNPVVTSGVAFEMVTVRYSDTTGTTHVRVTPDKIFENMPGAGPTVEAVNGRHGGEFTTFGDYSVNLFEKAEMHGNPHSRSLFDMAAVAILKNPEWAEKTLIPTPTLLGNSWKQNPDSANTIYIWENFDRDAILNDFFNTMKNYQLQ
jgi:purine nucleosidase